MIAGAMVVLGLGVAPSHADKRVALVVGNGAYQNLRQLPNPPNNARDLAAVLTSLGFDVDLGIDLRLPEMQRKVTEFARRARGADVALAFFAGHGVQAPDPLGSAHWSLRRNTDPTLPASHTVEITFKLPSDFAGGGISKVPGILMKEAEQSRGVPLAGLVVKVTNGFFLIGLSSVDADKERNIALLKERSCYQPAGKGPGRMAGRA
jgi:hypothetical protein